MASSGPLEHQPERGSGIARSVSFSGSRHANQAGISLLNLRPTGNIHLTVYAGNARCFQLSLSALRKCRLRDPIADLLSGRVTCLPDKSLPCRNHVGLIHSSRKGRICARSRVGFSFRSLMVGGLEKYGLDLMKLARKLIVSSQGRHFFSRSVQLSTSAIGSLFGSLM
jgi:hypothetical protein